MRWIAGVLGVVVCGIAVLVAIYEFGFTHRFRYRLTIEVSVDGQLKGGSGVIQVTGRPDLVPGRPLKYTMTFSGEAVEVDLGQRGSLFALLTFRDGFNAAYLPSKAFFSTAISADRAEQEERFKRLNDLVRQGARAELLPDQLPTLVMFKDLNDPRSVAQVPPNDLAAVFGDGVQFTRAVVEMTRDGVTSGIEARLPWLRTTTGYVDDQTTPNQRTLTNRLSPADFKWISDFGWWLR
jgi:hypothetical protein